eukprot:TRINITY_DN9697_c0_g1_i2.p1 TRINITY_DN9697_c0_g1~~TRINITY_DN9697_c0_g1_i2.p1  ORF type:complete len:329 (-),score=54.43 TRINITY_DN9697_c0_g1_i2:6-905(-)
MMERKGLNWQPATVFERNERIWLSLNCAQHGFIETLYCSNAEFFHRMSSFSINNLDQSKPPVDMEDLKERLQFSQDYSNLPLVMELPLWENGQFVSDDVIVQRIESFKRMYPPQRSFLLKVLAKLANDMAILNQKIRFVATLLPSSPIILETSYERICLLCQLEDSVFLLSNIYPALKYYLDQGNEGECQSELTQLFQHLKSFTNIQMMVTVSLNRPYPSLKSLMRFIREQVGFIRVFVISMERSPKQLLHSLSQKLSGLTVSLNRLCNSAGASIGGSNSEIVSQNRVFVDKCEVESSA